MRIRTTRPLHFRHNHKEFTTKGRSIIQEAPDWIAFDRYFAMAEACGALRVMPLVKAPQPRPVEPVVGKTEEPKEENQIGSVSEVESELPAAEVEAAPSDTDTLPDEGKSEAVTLESINAVSWQQAFKVVATLEDKALLKDIADNAKFESVKKAASDRLISLGDE